MSADLVAGFLTGAALIIAIGAQNAFVLRQGLRREHVLAIALVCATSDALLIAAGIAGLGALIRSTPVLLEVSRYGGALFLAAYGLAALRRALRARGMAVDAEVGSSLGAAMSACLAFTFLNPHVYLDTVVLVGSLASQRAGAGPWIFGAGAAAASYVWFFSLAFGARLLAPQFAQPVAWRVLDALIAVVMLGLAAALLVG